MAISGIYKIINRVNNKYYVGSSYNIIGCKGRWSHHKTHLKYNRHDNTHLQNAWNKYGKDSFDFTIVEETPKEKLIEVEQKYLDVAKNEQNKCYNISFSADRSIMEDSTKRKISNALKGKLVGDETKKRLSLSLKGHPKSQQHKINLSKSHIGKVRMPHTEETKLKISKSHKGNKNYNYDSTIYEWYNENTKESFNGTQYDFYTTYKFPSGSVNLITKGKRKSLYGWIIKLR